MPCQKAVVLHIYLIVGVVDGRAIEGIAHHLAPMLPSGQNVVIIIILMAAVSAFTLISVLLMIVLERIKMVGLLKTIGASNRSIRNIFIYLTHKVIFKSILVGNIIGIGFSMIQKYFHILKLDPEAYYMSYVPIEIDIVTLITLNVCILVISYITLLGPSHIISSIKPTTTMRFE